MIFNKSSYNKFSIYKPSLMHMFVIYYKFNLHLSYKDITKIIKTFLKLKFKIL